MDDSALLIVEIERHGYHEQTNHGAQAPDLKNLSQKG